MIRSLARLSVEEATIVRADDVIAVFFRLGNFDNAACLRQVLVSDDPLDAVTVEALVYSVPVSE